MYFTFNQNNPGGFTVVNDSVCGVVIIEADTADQANKKAEEIGIYFYGCSTGNDCPCCGDRWDAQYNDAEGTDEPEIYGVPVCEVKRGLFRSQAYIYRLGGTKEVVNFRDN
ncbi:hypothetical protein ABNC92_10725 [Paenibacillus larvae]|uniref:DUF7296 domain-containing protein n=4 Tax=Halcyonevirus TaxID=2843388 RepID=A0A345ASL5_9CAUD|nr:hypothetical protein [Paenibacillus larvae]YP_009210586.1 hypothetical protein TRIPP_66 [Paenibacillus phage Tripp]YP_010082225.1 hypothetical protein KMD17_gp58 [Paenibacillus phage C7Cdelta]AXF39985.1 hypothetical protein ASH_58 [Paenibacillus phage Ash]AXF40272.1 hypothetical protein LEY_58 [Paenibacillus phage Ley]ALH46439.1 hypothetical protein TRIPP_66 [Paenibacillus phage Tripp]AXF39819.1 hypothetical protein C7CDELTA_58 [Paenibacillus phage C7Cdelta]ETK28005.1 hypothetical protein